MLNPSRHETPPAALWPAEFTPTPESRCYLAGFLPQPSKCFFVIERVQDGEKWWCALTYIPPCHYAAITPLLVGEDLRHWQAFIGATQEAPRA